MLIQKTILGLGRVIIICLTTLSMTFLNASIAHRPHGHHQHGHEIHITQTQLQSDMISIKKYVTERIANDLKKAKKYGKVMAKAFAGISHYAFDAIPFEFFSDHHAIDDVFKRLASGIDYIQEKKEFFKKNIMGKKRTINQSQLAEFLYGSVVDHITVTADQRALLKRDPLKMDEFVRKGIVNRDEYMYYTLLNFVVRYYLEQEFKK